MKIAVIGAGINGLYLAWKLAKIGEDVTVFEKREKIGKECCSGLFSERILNFVPESEKLIQNKIEYCLIHFPGRTVKVRFSKKFLVMNHSELDNLVWSLAQNSGVKLLLNSNVTRQGLVTLGAKRVIGCDGVNSIVRKFLGLREPSFRLGIQGFVQKEDSSDFVETWPVKDGFLWKIPRGSETEYGAMGSPKEIKTIFDGFLEKNNVQLNDLKSALIPQGFLIPKNNSFTLCGDAAGLVKPWSGGGVVWGLMAADILLKNFPDFVKYQKAAKKLFLPKIFVSKMAAGAVYFLGFKLSRLLPKDVKIESDFLF